MALGIQPAAFWDLTPRELHAVFEGRQIRHLHEYRLAVFTAWKTANWQRAKKMPNLSAELEKLGPKVELTDAQLRDSLLTLHKALGGSVRVVPKGTIRKV